TVVAPDGAAFERAPAAEWHDRTFRAAFQAALDAAMVAPAQRFPLPGDVPSAGWKSVVSPSDPSGPALAEVEHASPEGMRAAIERAGEVTATWGAVPAAERARILCAAADLMLARGHELAAHVVREGGRD